MIAPSMPYAEYRAAPGLSASTCKMMATRPPAEVRYALDNPKPSTDRLVLGTYTHAMILEPEVLEGSFMVVEKFERRSAADKARWAEIVAESERTGKVIVWDALDHERRDTAMRMRDAIQAHPEARDLIANGRPEVSVFAEFEGEPIKSREDWMPAHSGLLVELKTTADPTPDAFRRSVTKYGYHIGAHHYRLCRRYAEGGSWPDYRWLAVGVTAPHLVAIYSPSDAMARLGEADWRRGFDAWNECHLFQQWPGLPPGVTELDPAPWELSRIDQ